MKIESVYRIALLLGLPIPLLISQYHEGPEKLFLVWVMAVLFAISISYLWRERAIGPTLFAIYYSLLFVLFFLKLARN